MATARVTIEPWWRRLRGIVDARIAGAGFHIFRTSVPIRVNLLHTLNHVLAKMVFALAGGPFRVRSAAHRAAAFRRDGFLVFPPTLPAGELHAFAARIDERFADPRNYTHHKGYETMAQLTGSVRDFPELASLLTEELIRSVEAYFGSYFKTCSVNIYRIMPSEFPPDGSFLWHFDKSPLQMIKCMVYLDDSSRETGAFRLKPKPLSGKLKRAGFWNRWKAEPFREALDEEATTRVFVGPTGTAVLFSAAECAHKATTPSRAHRDVVTFTFHPSLTPWSKHFAAISATKALSENYSSCRTPFTD